MYIKQAQPVVELPELANMQDNEKVPNPIQKKVSCLEDVPQ